MAKMFYTLEEAAKKLGVSAEKVREMASSGQLQEFRDRDKLVFKREQVDLLGGGDEPDATIPLADSGELPLAMDESKAGSSAGSVSGGTVGSTKERSGISIFEPEEGEDVDPSAQTQVTPSGLGGTLGDPNASGSGLMGLAQEADDTSLGGNLLDDAYGGGGGGGGEGGQGGALFEPAGVASDVSGGMGGGGVLVMAEPYDGPGSGLVGGLAFGMVAVLAVMLAGVLGALTGGSPIMALFAENLWMWVGIMAALPVVGGVVGFLIGR